MRTKYYLCLNAAERRLALDALIYFRNKAIANGINTIDIDGIIRKLQKRRWL